MAIAAAAFVYATYVLFALRPAAAYLVVSQKWSRMWIGRGSSIRSRTSSFSVPPERCPAIRRLAQVGAPAQASASPPGVMTGPSAAAAG